MSRRDMMCLRRIGGVWDRPDKPSYERSPEWLGFRRDFSEKWEGLRMVGLLGRVFRDERGAALVEYGILVGLIAVVCIAAVAIVGTQVSAAFSSIASALTSAF